MDSQPRYNALWERTKKLPPKEVLRKLTVKLKNQASIPYLSLKRSLGLAGWSSRNRLLKALLQGPRKQPSLTFPFWDITHADRLADQLKDYYPEHAKKVVSKAYDILAGDYEILAPGPLNLKRLSIELATRHGVAPTYLPWHYDWLLPYRWDPQLAHPLCTPEAQAGADIKLPWELSRFHHLVTLAQAFILTRQRAMLDEMTRQFNDWYASNPPGYGVNWACPMDISIRLANVSLAFSMVIYHLDRADKDHTKALDQLDAFVFDHTTHVIRHPEWPSNHLIADHAGVALAARIHQGFHYSSLWLAHCLAGLRREAQRQIYADGMDFEASTSYHGLVLEMYLFCWLSLDEAQRRADPWLKSTTLKLLKAAAAFAKPSGYAPQFGDNDSGRFLDLAADNAASGHDHLRDIGALAFDAPELIRDPSQQPTAAALWLLGPEALQSWEKIRRPRSRQPQVPQALALPDAGIHTFKDGQTGHYLAISNGPNGQNDAGGHAHNDRLSFEYSPFGEDLIVDPGTGVYLRAPWLRDELRSVKAHNTVCVANQEQNRFVATFQLAQDVKNPRCLEARYDARTAQYHYYGQHDGYLRLATPILHKRRFTLSLKDMVSLIIEDDLITTSPAKDDGGAGLSWNLTLAPGVSVISCDPAEALLRTPSGKTYRVTCNLPIERADAHHSPAFGKKHPTAALRWRCDAALPCKYKFEITMMSAA
ncbi:MAG: alginate lyase family protein [Elusimicrobiota bacterium]